MRHGSLFSGIGGFDLSAEWMGWENVFHCEWKEFNQKILKYYWPNAISYTDITKTDFTPHRGSIDILTGGFPCQPYSVAGKRKGKEDDRHLWPEMLRAVREIQPRWIVGENVGGLVSWNGGMVFEEVQTDLEAEGYEVQAFILPACAVNAPHKRDRIWIVANSISSRQSQSENVGGATKTRFVGVDGLSCSRTTTNANKLHGNISGLRTGKIPQFEKASILLNNVTNTNGIRLRSEGDRIGKSRFTYSQGAQNDWENFPTQSPICFGDDGLSSKLDGITFPKWRSESIMGAGNAIVPQVACEIFKAIQQLNLL